MDKSRRHFLSGLGLAAGATAAPVAAFASLREPTTKIKAPFSIIYRLEKGAALTSAEVDSNFRNLQAAIEELQKIGAAND